MTNPKFRFKFIWIPNSLGGHNVAPWEGMRTTIRWSRYLKENLEYSRDALWNNIDFDSETLQGEATCQLISTLPSEWLIDEEQIEMLNGFRVLAIGRIIGVNNAKVK